MGTVVVQKQKVLSGIKEDAAASASVPALRLQVENLADEVQKIKDALLGKIVLSDD